MTKINKIKCDGLNCDKEYTPGDMEFDTLLGNKMPFLSMVVTAGPPDELGSSVLEGDFCSVACLKSRLVDMREYLNKKYKSKGETT